MKKKRVFPSISESWEDWLKMPVNEKYEELKTLYETENPNGDLEYFFKMELQFQIDAERELINKGAKREIHENEELIQRQMIIQYIKDEMLKTSIEKSFLSEPIYNPKTELRNYAFYNNAKNQIENNGYFIINGIKVYTPELVVLFMSDNIQVKNKFTGEDCFLNGFDFLKIFILSYQKGQKYFNENYKVSPDILYGANAQSYVSDLHNNYFHIKEYGANEGWIFVKNMYPIFISNEAISKHGYYSGIISQADEQVKNHTMLFKTFESCEKCMPKEFNITDSNNLKNIKNTLKIPEERANELIEILKDYFRKEQISDFENLIITGSRESQKLVFEGNSNQLTDSFKLLFEKKLIIGFTKEKLKTWLFDNFQVLIKGKVSDLNKETLHKSISGKRYPCKKPIIKYENGKICRFD